MYIADIKGKTEFLRDETEFADLIEKHMGGDARMLYLSIIRDLKGEIDYLQEEVDALEGELYGCQ